MALTAGTIQSLSIDGIQLSGRIGATITESFRGNEVHSVTVAGVNTKATYREGKIMVEIDAEPGVDYRTMTQHRNVEIIVTQANGAVYRGTNMTYIGAGEQDGEDGKYTLEYAGTVRRV